MKISLLLGKHKKNISSYSSFYSLKMISKKGKKIIASEDDFSFKPKTKITWQGSVAIRIDSKNMITINLFPLEKETRFSSERFQTTMDN